MLLNVHVKNLALIEDIDVYFGEGLNILTGETGAGKSIILGAINIALGQKAPKEIVRQDAEYGLAELIFSIEDEATSEELKKYGVYLDENKEVIVSRRIQNGRSTTKINGEAIPLSELKAVAALLINIHGQRDNGILLNKNKHLDILDQYGGTEITGLKTILAELTDRYKATESRLEELSMDEEERTRELSLCQYQLDEIEEAALVPGEDILLEERFKLVSNSKKIVESLMEIEGLIGYEGALGLIGNGTKSINGISGFDVSIENLQSQLYDIEALCSDFEKDVRAYIDKLSFDEEECIRISERLNLINKLKSKYGKSIEDIQDYGQKSRNRLELLENIGVERENIIKELDVIEKEYYKNANKLTELREKTKEVFSKDLTNALMELNFMQVAFSIDIKHEKVISPKGCEQAEFMISTNPGEKEKPMAEIASGGELSRIMLGLKSIMANREQISTMIFDEIDAGISGRTAQKVSEKLGALSKTHQIICITHLPQIAAMADKHYLIEKSLKADKTVTEIELLDEEHSIIELGRMLGGVEITDSVIANAREMRELVKSVKNK